MRFTRAELEEFRGCEVDDLVGPGLRLLFVGINPGLWTAAVGTHFAHPTNRFYPALAAAGITAYEVDRVAGMTAADRAHLVARGVGITNLVRRATARASELSREELREGGERLLRFVAEHRPGSSRSPASPPTATPSASAARPWAGSPTRSTARATGPARRSGWYPTPVG